jgi:hypothetical protein
MISGLIDNILAKIKRIDFGNPLIWAGALGVIFLLTVVLFGARSATYTERVFFYPQHTTLELHGEKRSVRTKFDLRSEVETYLQDLALGPINKLLDNFLSTDATIDSVFVKKGAVIVNFSREMAVIESESRFKVKDIKKFILTNLKFNFPGIKSVEVYIDGHLPESDFHADFLYSGQ